MVFILWEYIALPFCLVIQFSFIVGINNLDILYCICYFVNANECIIFSAIGSVSGTRNDPVVNINA